MGKRIGYARVSTDDQNLYLQRDVLTRAECATIYEETASGKSAGRPELEHCLKALRSGDVLVVWRLDRLGRSLPDLVTIVSEGEELTDADRINFVNHIAGKMMESEMLAQQSSANKKAQFGESPDFMNAFDDAVTWPPTKTTRTRQSR